MPLHAGQRERVGALAEQRADAADQRREVAVHAPHDAVRLEPARSLTDRRDVADPGGRAGRVAGHPGAEALAGELGQVRQGQGHRPSLPDAAADYRARRA